MRILANIPLILLFLTVTAGFKSSLLEKSSPNKSTCKVEYYIHFNLFEFKSSENFKNRLFLKKPFYKVYYDSLFRPIKICFFGKRLFKLYRVIQYNNKTILVSEKSDLRLSEYRVDSVFIFKELIINCSYIYPLKFSNAETSAKPESEIIEFIDLHNRDTVRYSAFYIEYKRNIVMSEANSDSLMQYLNSKNEFVYDYEYRKFLLDNNRIKVILNRKCRPYTNEDCPWKDTVLLYKHFERSLYWKDETLIDIFTKTF